MNVQSVLLTIQYATILVLFVELVMVFMKWNNTIHSYLFLACVASFISNLGYLLMLQASSEEVYISALKFSYAGRTWIVFALFVFAARLCRIKIPKMVALPLVLAHAGIYMSILALESNKLYYSDYKVIIEGGLPEFYHTNGILHDVLLVFNGIFIVLGMSWLIKDHIRERNRTSKKRILMVIAALGVQAVFLCLHISGIFWISRYYNLAMPGALFGTIFTLIAIFRFDLLGTKEIARDFVIDRISEGIIAVDNDGRIQYYNEPAARIYPEFALFFSPEDEKKEGPKDMPAPPRIYTPYDVLAFIKEAVEKGDTLKIGDRIFTPEENDLVYAGERYGKLYALIDSTQHYQDREELEKQRDIADRANEAKSRFLANMSHEIRTPINAILGMDEMILRESTEAPISGYASDIMSAGRTLLSLINDILDLSKVEEGKMEIIPVHYDLSSLINDLVNMIRDRASQKGLKLNVKADREVPHLLCGDEIRIRQCAMNLLTNAVKYTEAGEVTLSVSFEKAEPDHILLTFKVEDTGIGMKAEDMEKLFSPYERIEEKRNRAIEGTGLGMSITRQLLDLMGSELKVESQYGKGSTFSFAVNQEVVKWEELGDYSARFDDTGKRSYEYHELFHAPDARILVVDDTEMNLTVIQSLLKKTGIVIDTAASGRNALALAAASPYDALFIDHMMPDMDGIETLKAIRESGLNKETPAVALTANAVSGAREMYLRSGFTDYLSKPVDGERLEKMLYNLLPDDKLLDAGADIGTEETPARELPDWLKGIEEIDTESGLANCGSGEGYISVLSVFHQTAAAKADEIEDYYKKGDIANYTIKVHALKSSARIIGAKDLSGKAKDLEDAGKREDTGFIGENTDELLKLYRALDEKLSGLDEANEDLREIDEKALREAYQTITEIAGSMDYGMMDDMLKDLHGYSLPPADRERISKVETLLSELDWDGIIQVAGEGM